AHVPQLGEDGAAARVHGRSNALPALHLRCSVQARGEQVAARLLGDLGALADDQPGAGALAVVLRRQRVGHRAGRPRPGHGCHHDAVAQLQPAQVELLEQLGHGNPGTGIGCNKSKGSHARWDPGGWNAGSRPGAARAPDPPPQAPRGSTVSTLAMNSWNSLRYLRRNSAVESSAISPASLIIPSRNWM